MIRKFADPKSAHDAALATVQVASMGIAVKRYRGGRHPPPPARRAWAQLGGITSKMQAVERARRTGDQIGGDAGINRGSGQPAMAEQDPNNSDVGSCFKQMGGEAVAQGMDGDRFVQAGLLRCDTARRLQGGGADRPVPVTPGEQSMHRLGQAPISPQDRQRRRRQHDVAVLATLALRDADHHPAAVEVADLECRDLGYPQAGAIGCC